MSNGFKEDGGGGLRTRGMTGFFFFFLLAFGVFECKFFLRVQGLGYYLSYNIKAPGVFNSSLLVPLPLPFTLNFVILNN